MRQYGRLTILLPILFVGFLFLPAPSDAQHSSGVIYACVGKYTGLTRIVEANEACRPAETRLQWNVTGPVGPVGPVGPPGAAGAAGVPGIPGPPGPVGIPVPVAVTVDCAMQQTISQVLQTTSGQPLTITVNGTCTENLVITRDDVTLTGGTGGGTITATGAASETIQIDGAKRVVLDTLTITGGVRGGIRAFRGASVTVHNATIQGAGGDGVLVTQSSRATIDGNTIQNHGWAGISVQNGSSATITANLIKGNGSDGIDVGDASVARIGLTEYGVGAGNTIEGNNITLRGGGGIEISNSSAGRLYGNTIRNNTGIGIAAYRQAVIRLVGGNTIQNNTSSGVFVRASTLGTGFMLAGPQPPISDVISGNPGSGIAAEENSSLDLRDGLTITGNSGAAGIFAQHGVRIVVRNTSITNNTSNGILLQLGSSVRFLTPSSTITGNTGWGLFCIDGESSVVGYNNVTGGTNGLGEQSQACTGF